MRPKPNSKPSPDTPADTPSVGQTATAVPETKLDLSLHGDAISHWQDEPNNPGNGKANEPSSADEEDR